MLIQIILTAALLLVLYVANCCWIRPRKIMKFYQTQLKDMKYKSKIIPYKMFYIRTLSPQLEGKKLGDPGIYYKTQLPKYDIVVSNIMSTPCIEIGHIDFLKDIYSMDKHYQYPKLKIFTNPLVNLVGNGLLFSQGNVWKQKRILLNKLFNFDFVKMQIPNIVNICDRCIKQMEQKAKKGVDESGRYVQCYMLTDLLTNIFSTVIFSGFIGIKNKYQIDGIQVIKYLLKIVDDVGEYRLLSPTFLLGNWFFNLQLRKIDKSINQRKKKLKNWGIKVLQIQMNKINTQIQKGNKIEVDNLIKAYILYKRQNNISDDIISNEDIFAQFLGFMFAGTDTTSNYLNSMLSYIAINPEVQKQLRKQIDQYMKNDDYSHDNLKNFKYIQAVQKQTTRAYGPVNFSILRQATEDNYLNGLAIKKGTIVSLITYANHYSQKYFKEPMKFRPERWLNGQCEHLDPFVLMGFSGGGRTCIGKHLALLESKIALIKILKRYKKITLGKQDFKWDKKLFTMPEYFETKFTINE